MGLGPKDTVYTSKHTTRTKDPWASPHPHTHTQPAPPPKQLLLLPQTESNQSFFTPPSPGTQLITLNNLPQAEMRNLVFLLIDDILIS